MASPTRRFALSVAALVPLGACAPTRVEPTSSPNAMALPSAERVVVAAFTGIDAETLRRALVERLRARGLVAAVGDGAAASDRSLLVQGQIAPTPPVDRPRLIGGASAEVQLLYVLDRSAPQFLESFQVEASAPRITAGAERDRLADAIAGRIAQFAESRGWR